ncbi:MAG: CotH kinase family protein, partial [Anaerolineales bacterium]|nr:CotH kinase family protein [Anaerolineales bacterium]
MTRKLPLLHVGLFVALLVLPLLFFGAAAAADTDIVLNELMASNTSTLADEDGDFSDWIELRNSGGAPVSLDSWYLTDDPLDLTKWQLPNLSLAADEYLVIFASGKNRLGAELHTNFSLKATGEYLALVAADGSTIISEFNPSFPAQQNDISYGVIQPGITGYLSTPTPGATNDTAIPFVEVSEPSQVFTSTLSVSLTALTIPGDTIRYTLDGSEPTGGSAVYSTPLNISNSTRLRARVFRDGTGGITNYGVYIKVAAEVANFDSDLPLVVVDTFNQSITTAYKQAFIAIIDTGNGPLVDRARIIDMPDYAGFAGIHRRGSSSGSFPKKQYKVELWDDANNSVDASLLGMPRESDWILYAPGRYERNMIANPLAHQLATDSDMIGFKTQFVELYLNDDDTNAVAANDYDGIYIWMENIKQGDDRVDVQDMEIGDNEEPAVTGGYIWSIDRQDASQYDFRLPSGYPGTEPGSSSSYINIVYPKEASLTIPQRDYFIDQMLTLESVANSSTFSDPQSGYLKYIDMESWANGYLMDIFVKDPDLLRLSHFFYKPRYGKLYNDIAWDYDRTMESDDSRDNDPEGLINYTVCYDFWETFLTDPDFEQALVDQWFELRRTTMNTAYIYPLIDQQAAEI